MVRRILEDSYKPLRVKGYQKPIPQPAALPAQLFPSPSAEAAEIAGSSSASSASPPPSSPFFIDFKAPDHYNPAPGYRAQPAGVSAAAAKKAAARAGAAAAGGAGKGGKLVAKARLASAYERTLDYAAGVRPEQKQRREGEKAEGEHDAAQLGVPSLGGWAGIVENRILQSMREGSFKHVKGRGKPLERDEAESNPFISREDFLINRVLKQQDVSPPWVELQKELETALSAFRSNLHASYTRRVLRIRSSEGLTGAVVREVEQGWRDEEWEKREQAFHDAALLDLNNLTRKFNIIAPYHVRRSLLTLHSELNNTIVACSPSIAKELQRRLDAGMMGKEGRVVWKEEGDDDGVKSVTAEEMGGEKEADKTDTPWRAFKRLVVEVLAKPPDPQPVQARARE
ncbi:hypothetical protein JCM8547_002119 [Rhodosporidiobolus lusitaniae]